MPMADRFAARVLVCGSRHWTDKSRIRRALAQFDPGDVLIHGGAQGADTIAGEAARDLGLTVEVFPADWKTHGNAAGPIRNQRMLDEGKPHCVVAFPLPGSIGTWDMIRRANKTDIPVFMPLDGGEVRRG
jgi:hypothetical protein